MRHFETTCIEIEIKRATREETRRFLKNDMTFIGLLHFEKKCISESRKK